jgi:hypothetical protein
MRGNVGVNVIMLDMFALVFNLQVQWSCQSHHYFMKRYKSSLSTRSSITIGACDCPNDRARDYFGSDSGKDGAVSYCCVRKFKWLLPKPLIRCVMPKFMVDSIYGAAWAGRQHHIMVAPSSHQSCGPSVIQRIVCC